MTTGERPPMHSEPPRSIGQFSPHSFSFNAPDTTHGLLCYLEIHNDPFRYIATRRKSSELSGQALNRHPQKRWNQAKNSTIQSESRILRQMAGNR